MTTPSCRAALAELAEIDDLRIAINASKVVDGHRVLFFLSATEADKARAEVSQRFPAAWAAARSALAQEAVPPGFVMVPKEPTPEMIRAIGDVVPQGPYDFAAIAVYKAMLAAAIRNSDAAPVAE